MVKEGKAWLTLFMPWPRVGDLRASDDTSAWFAYTSSPHLTDRGDEDDLDGDNFLLLCRTKYLVMFGIIQDLVALNYERLSNVTMFCLFSQNRPVGAGGHPCCYQFPQERRANSNFQIAAPFHYRVNHTLLTNEVAAWLIIMTKRQADSSLNF